MNDAQPPQGGKGRPTPTRKEAQDLRKQQMKKPVTRRDQAARDRRARSGVRQREMDALNGTGDPKYLPVRDRGPARALTRDFVDRRFTIAEYMLPILVLILLLSLVRVSAVQATVLVLWSVIIVLTVVDESLMLLGLSRELKKRFTKAESRGCTFYAVLRSTQLRPMRRPKAVVKRREPLRARY